MKLGKISLNWIGCGLAVTGLLVAGIAIGLGGSPQFSVGPDGIRTAQREKSETYELQKTRLDSFKSMNIRGKQCDIIVEPSDDFYLEYRIDSRSGEPIYGVEGDVLQFVSRPEENTVNNVFFYIFDFNMSVNKKDQNYIKIYMPQDLALEDVKAVADIGSLSWNVPCTGRNVTLESSFGSLQASDISVKERLRAENSNGKVVLSNITARELSAETSFGNLNLEKIAGETILATNSNGWITVSGAEGEKLKAETSFGNLEITGADVPEVTVINSNGKILLADLTGESLKAETSFGNLEITGADVREYVIGNSNGAVRLKDLNGGSLIADTSFSGMTVADAVLDTSVKLTNSNGKIDIASVQADEKFYVETSFADIMCTGLKAPEVDAVNSNGKLKLEEVDTARLKAQTSFGDIYADLRNAGANFGIQARTSFGSVIVDGEKHGEKYSRKEEGDAGNATLDNSNGSIEIVTY